MGKKVLIIGGGIIGVSTAFYLVKEGCNVTIIDKGDFSTGASFINAGYITPSHIIPLAAPGMITKGIKWMFNTASPFYVKPRLDIDFLRWSWAFKKSSTKARVEKAIPVIKDINLLSRDLYADIKASGDFNFEYDRKGLLMCYKTEKGGENEWKIGQRAIKEGLIVKNLSADEVSGMEPNTKINIKGAVYYESDAHMTPDNYMNNIITYLKDNGVTFLSNEEVTDFHFSSKKITKVITPIRTIEADEIVIASGSWSSSIAKKLDVKIPLQAGKGYSINVKHPTGITIPAILTEAKVAVTPMKNFTRFAGTMEIAGINHEINPLRVKAIANAAKEYYNELQIKQTELDDAQCGLRPCSPDGLPFIGRAQKYKNLIIATGHAMMGWSLGPATGKIVSEIILDKKLSIQNIDAFYPERKF